MENLIYIGLRYGVSTLTKLWIVIKFTMLTRILPDTPAIQSGEKYSGLSAQWAEVVVVVLMPK